MVLVVLEEGSVVLWEAVLETVSVEQLASSRAELLCIPFPSRCSRNPVGLETRRSPTVRIQPRNRTGAMSLSLTTAKGEAGSAATDSTDSRT